MIRGQSRGNAPKTLGGTLASAKERGEESSSPNLQRRSSRTRRLAGGKKRAASAGKNHQLNTAAQRKYIMVEREAPGVEGNWEKGLGRAGYNTGRQSVLPEYRRVGPIEGRQTWRRTSPHRPKRKEQTHPKKRGAYQTGGYDERLRGGCVRGLGMRLGSRVPINLETKNQERHQAGVPGDLGRKEDKA